MVNEGGLEKGRFHPTAASPKPAGWICAFEPISRPTRGVSAKAFTDRRVYEVQYATEHASRRNNNIFLPYDHWRPRVSPPAMAEDTATPWILARILKGMTFPPSYSRQIDSLRRSRPPSPSPNPRNDAKKVSRPLKLKLRRKKQR